MKMKRKEKKKKEKKGLGNICGNKCCQWSGTLAQGWRPSLEHWRQWRMTDSTLVKNSEFWGMWTHMIWKPSQMLQENSQNFHLGMFSQPPLNAFCQAATGTATTELLSNRASAIVSQYLWSCCQSAKDSCCQTVTQLVPPPLSMFSQTVKAVAQLPTFSWHAQSKSHSTNTAVVR